jgi:hypothetical protein
MWSQAAFATSSTTTLNISVVVQRSCTITRTAAGDNVDVKCAAGGPAAVIDRDAAETTRGDDRPPIDVARASTADATVRYVTIQF